MKIHTDKDEYLSPDEFMEYYKSLLKHILDNYDIAEYMYNTLISKKEK